MRNTLLFAAIAAPVVIAIIQHQEQAAEIAALAEEVRAARAADARRAQLAPAGPLRLDAFERDRLAEAISARMPVPERAVPRAAPASHAQPAPAKEGVPEREPTEAQRAASGETRRFVEAVLASGTLRREDMVRIKQLMAAADPKAVVELRRRIAVALNRDELRPADPSAMLP